MVLEKLDPSYYYDSDKENSQRWWESQRKVSYGRGIVTGKSSQNEINSRWWWWKTSRQQEHTTKMATIDLKSHQSWHREMTEKKKNRRRRKESGKAWKKKIYKRKRENIEERRKQKRKGDKRKKMTWRLIRSAKATNSHLLGKEKEKFETVVGGNYSL